MTATYSDYANKTRSSKVVLCHVEPKQRLSVFSLDSGTIYRKAVDYFVINVSEDNSDLTEASSSSLSSGEWYYDAISGDLYVNTTDDTDPRTKKIIVTYRLFYSNRSIDLPYNLNSGVEVSYDGRIKDNSPINKQLDEEQIGVVLETSTNLSFENTDGHFDEFYDVLIFENKSIKIWSWSEILPLSEKVKIFDGIIQNKSFSEKDVKFSCKDFTYNLRKPLSLSNFTTSDGDIPERYLNTPKRKVYGQYKQLRCVPIDAILDGFTLSGTIVGASGSAILTGTGTSFLSECSPQDELIFQSTNETFKFSIKSVDSDTQITLSSELEISLDAATLKNKPKRPYRGKNRNWHIAGHKLRSPITTVDTGTQPNRFTVDDSTDLFAGDLVKVDGESAFIKRITDSNIVLETNLQGGTPINGNTVIKNPLNKAFIDGSEIFIDRDWSVTNGTNDAILNLDPLVEFNVAPIVTLGFDVNFTNASRGVTVTGFDMKTEIQSRDWIRSQDISHTTWYEVLDVVYDNDTTISTITLRTAYAGATGTYEAEKKNVDLVNDDSVVCVNGLGLERSGSWVKTASDAVKDILENDAGLTNIDTASFAEADSDAPFTLSYAIPESIGGANKQIKQVISDINESVFGSLVINNDFNLRYQALLPEKPSYLEELKDDDILGVSSIRSRNEITRKVNAKYSPFVDKFNGENAFELYEFESDFVDDLVGSLSEKDITLYLFSQDDATTIAQRYALYNSLSQSTVTVRGKLNLALKMLNDKMYLSLRRLYKRFGGRNRSKIGIINKVSNNGSEVTIEFNDLSNIFNRVANISDNSANDFTSADDSEKMIYSYIVDDETLTPDITSDDEIFQNIIG